MKTERSLRYFIYDCSQVFDYMYLHLAINTEVCTWQLALSYGCVMLRDMSHNTNTKHSWKYSVNLSIVEIVSGLNGPIDVAMSL